MSGTVREYDSRLTREELCARLKAKCRGWLKLDLWTARNKWFWREKGDNLWLVKTGPFIGYVRAEIQVVPGETGSKLCVKTGIPKTRTALNWAILLLYVLFIGDSLILGNWVRSMFDLLRYGWIPLIFFYFTKRLKNSLGDLTGFIEENLLD